MRQILIDLISFEFIDIAEVFVPSLIDNTTAKIINFLLMITSPW